MIMMISRIMRCIEGDDVNNHDDDDDDVEDVDDYGFRWLTIAKVVTYL